MSYNSQCTVQTCASGCCNYYGDCPEWYSNGISLYTDCYNYYSLNQTNIFAAVGSAIIGFLAIILIMCICYRYERSRLDQQTFQQVRQRANTQPSMGDIVITQQKALDFEKTGEWTKQKKNSKKSVSPSKTQQLHGIGKEYNS